MLPDASVGGALSSGFSANKANLVFSKVEAVLSLLKLNPDALPELETLAAGDDVPVGDRAALVRDFKAALQWVKGKLDKKQNDIETLKALLDEMLSEQKAIRQNGDRSFQHVAIPEDEMTEHYRQIFDRIERIVGYRIHPEDRSYAMAQVCENILHKLYVRDPLTDLLSNHSLVESLEDIINRRSQLRQSDERVIPCTVAVCDLNGFKQFNSHFSHENTDKILPRIARRLREAADLCIGEFYIPPGFTTAEGKKYHGGMLSRSLVSSLTPADNDRRREMVLRLTDAELEAILPIARLKSAGDEFCFILPCPKAAAAWHLQWINEKMLAPRRFQFAGDVPSMRYNGVAGVSMSYGCYQLDSVLVPDQSGRVYVDRDISAVLTAATDEMYEFKRQFKKDNYFRNGLSPEPIFLRNPNYNPPEVDEDLVQTWLAPPEPTRAPAPATVELPDSISRAGSPGGASNPDMNIIPVERRSSKRGLE